MRIKGMLALTAFLAAAAVGLAMASTGGGVSPAQEQDRRPQDRQMGPPPGPRGGGPQGIERLLFDVDLTPAQLDQIKALASAEREAGAARQEQLREVGDKMRALIEADTFDEVAVRDLAAREAALTAELRVSGARTESAIFQLLTAEQKAALSKLRDQQPSRPPRR
jgi:periplasmic protein CpxP/Spy